MKKLLFLLLLVPIFSYSQSEMPNQVNIGKVKLIFPNALIKSSTLGFKTYDLTNAYPASSSGQLDSSTWYRVGTTVASDNINDNVYRNGFVGIGTTTPTNLLNVQNTAGTNQNLVLFKSLNGNGGYALRGESVNAGGALGVYGELGVFDGTIWSGVRGNSGVSTAPAITGFSTITNGFSAYFNQRVAIGITTPTSTLHINGSEAGSITNITATTTLNETHHKILVSNGATNITITLPNALTCLGREYVFSRAAGSTGSITIVGGAGNQMQALNGAVGATTSISLHTATGGGLRHFFTAVNIAGVGYWVRL